MCTKMEDTDWANEFRPSLPQRGANSRDDRLFYFWKRCSRFTTSPGGRCRSGSASGTACGSAFDRLSKRRLLDQNPPEDGFDGHPIASDLTGGEKADAPHFPILLGLGPDTDPRAVIGDERYASKANRQEARIAAQFPSSRTRSTKGTRRHSSQRHYTRAEPARKGRRQDQALQVHCLRLRKDKAKLPIHRRTRR